MADVISIKTLAGEFKTQSELQTYADKQFVALQNAGKKIAHLEEEVSHLKNLLITTTSLLPKDSKLILTTEEAICEAQIALLQERGMTKELTLEEVKRLDLLIKNKRLAKEQATSIPGEAKIIRMVPEAELLKIASKEQKDETTI